MIVCICIYKYNVQIYSLYNVYVKKENDNDNLMRTLMAKVLVKTEKKISYKIFMNVFIPIW